MGVSAFCPTVVCRSSSTYPGTTLRTARKTANEKYPRALIVGVRDRYQVIETADMEEMAGIVIRPGGFTGLFRERADLFFQRSMSLEEIWREPQLVQGMQVALTPVQKLGYLDGLLVGLIRERSRRSDLADHAIHLFRTRGLSIAGCAHSIGVSERRLSQVFREEVGIAPRLWCRIRRFQAATRAMHAGVEVRWAELALNCGYYDQSHFANDFRAFSGLDATAYSKHKSRWQNHVSLD